MRELWKQFLVASLGAAAAAVAGLFLRSNDLDKIASDRLIHVEDAVSSLAKFDEADDKSRTATTKLLSEAIQKTTENQLHNQELIATHSVEISQLIDSEKSLALEVREQGKNIARISALVERLLPKGN